ncbi:MAG: tetratricopeptide repeat protein [Candidatus Hydrogenedentes bacterium]|nr:tetratricopeptide repeat protein [Candidatus Hydrogenedentota bacterium]
MFAGLALLVGFLAPRPAFGVSPWDPAAPYADAYRSGRYAEALEELDRAIAGELGQPPASWLADQAELLWIVGRHSKAITVMGDVVRRVYEPAFTVRLAAMYRELGQSLDAQVAVDLAVQQSRSRQSPSYLRENLIAIGQIALWQGENPRTILQFYQQRVLQRYPDFVAGYVAAGQLALDGYAYDLAEKYFQQALDRDSMRQPALAGMAETYYRAGDPAFEGIAELLRAINPNHSRLLQLLAERALMGGNLDEARALLDTLLGFNPAHGGGLALRAAAAFLAGDGEKQREALARLAEINPASGEGYRILGDLAARHYRFEEAAAFLRQGVAIDPENVRARASLGLNLLRLGEDAEGRTILEEVFEDDPYNVQVYNMLEVLDSLDAFETVRNANFTVTLPNLEAAVMGPDAVGLLEEALARYETEYQVGVKRPVHVQFFDDHDEFMVRSIGLPGNPGHLGICFGNLVTMDSPRAREPRSMNWRSVLWHEFVHVITLQKTANRIPRWLSEGISVYEEGQRDSSWGQPLDPDFQPLLAPGEWPDMAALERYFVAPESPIHLIFGYFLAGAFVESYVDAYGKPALVAALDAIRDGALANEALVGAAGVDGGQVNEAFAAHLARVCAPLLAAAEEGDRNDPAPEGFFGEEHGPDIEAVELALRGQKALDSGEINQAIEHFEAAAAQLPALPGDLNPLRNLVEIRRASGDLEQWYQEVRRLQRHVPTAFDETKALMEALEAEGDWPRVLDLARWCAGIDPFDVEVHSAQMHAERALGDREGLMATLDRLAALDTAQADTYRLGKARVLFESRRLPEARNEVLALLERYPAYREAQELLLELHETDTEVHREAE